VARIDSMKHMLYKRDLLFLQYIKQRAVLLKNDTLVGQVKNLSALIDNERKHTDSNFVTTSSITKTTIDTLNNDDGKQSLWRRIFSKRKPQIKQVQQQIEEDMKVHVDTMYKHTEGDSLANIGRAITEVELNRIALRGRLLKRQAELNSIGNMLTAQLLSTLNDMDNDELARAAQQNNMANIMVDRSIVSISMVLLVFVLATGVLVFFIFSDISRSNKYKRELIVANELAEEAGQVKQRFLANMSHELRTPLQTIIGISEQIRYEQTPGRQALENIHQSSLHLLQTVNEVLDYSRITSGKFAVVHKPFSMLAVLDEVREMIQVQVAAKRLSFTYAVTEPADNYYSGDAFRLKQVLLNLLANAVKFTDHGNVSLTVTTQAGTDEASLFSFLVADTGTGISRADQELIFNQFEQGSDGHIKQGTGLGLSIVKALVEIQHGTIAVDSEPGKGTKFLVTMPYQPTQAIAQADKMMAVRPQPAGLVWVIDDDPFILGLCDSILTKHRIAHTCFLAAIAVLGTPFPADLQVVLLDIRMPDIDGITLCGRLRQRPGAQPAYIALTAQALPDEQEAILQEGFDAVVMKPFLELDFMTAIYSYSETQAVPVRLDISSIRKMVGDNDDALDKTLQQFKTETQKDMLEARRDVAAADALALAEALHRLAGRCGQLGAALLAQRLRMLEINLRNSNDITVALDDMGEVYQELDGVIVAIEALRGQSRNPA
jgi:signal transduction histidine kinase/CheY-like chemotaxis protein